MQRCGPLGCDVDSNENEFDDGIVHHGGTVKDGIGGVNNVENSVGTNFVLDSVHKENKSTFQ